MALPSHDLGHPIKEVYPDHRWMDSHLFLSVYKRILKAFVLYYSQSSVGWAGSTEID
jgi:hypothetical protein